MTDIDLAERFRRRPTPNLSTNYVFIQPCTIRTKPIANGITFAKSIIELLKKFVALVHHIFFANIED